MIRNNCQTIANKTYSLRIISIYFFFYLGDWGWQVILIYKSIQGRLLESFFIYYDNFYINVNNLNRPIYVWW